MILVIQEAIFSKLQNFSETQFEACFYIANIGRYFQDIVLKMKQKHIIFLLFNNMK